MVVDEELYLEMKNMQAKVAKKEPRSTKAKSTVTIEETWKETREVESSKKGKELKIWTKGD